MDCYTVDFNVCFHNNLQLNTILGAFSEIKRNLLTGALQIHLAHALTTFRVYHSQRKSRLTRRNVLTSMNSNLTISAFFTALF